MQTQTDCSQRLASVSQAKKTACELQAGPIHPFTQLRVGTEDIGGLLPHQHIISSSAKPSRNELLQSRLACEQQRVHHPVDSWKPFQHNLMQEECMRARPMHINANLWYRAT